MKKNRTKIANKTFIASLVLLVAIAGVATTIALAMAESNVVTNEFGVAKIVTNIDETIGTDLTKRVKVTNGIEAEANSPAYIRVRFNVSPDDSRIHLFANEKDDTVTNEISKPSDNDKANGWEYYDGFWYYLSPVEPKGATSELLKYLEVDDGFTDPFDVVVYQESCIASETVDTAAEIQSIFDKATEINTSRD